MIMTELGTTQMVTVTLKGADGYAGNVTVTPSVVDANNAPLTGWTLSAPETVTVATNGTQVVVVTLTIPSENMGLVGTLKIDATTSATEGTHAVSVPVTVLNQVTFRLTNNGNQCAYESSTAVNVSEGTKIIFFNGSTINLIVHSNGGSYGINHQDVGTTTAPNATYERTVTAGSADGTPFDWYCHSPGPDLGGGLPASNAGNLNPKVLVKAVPAT